MRSRLVAMEVAHGVRSDSYVDRHSTQVHEDHLESCIIQERERTSHTCTCVMKLALSECIAARR